MNLYQGIKDIIIYIQKLSSTYQIFLKMFRNIMATQIKLHRASFTLTIAFLKNHYKVVRHYRV